MNGLLHPIHVEAIGLANVRFFAPPTGGREFPWVSIDDLFAAVVMDRRMRRAFHSDLGVSAFASSTQKIVTPEGRTTIGPHFIAQGLIDAWTHVGRTPAGFYAAYTAGGVKALGKLLPGVDGDELAAYLGDAFKAGGGGS